MVLSLIVGGRGTQITFLAVSGLERDTDGPLPPPDRATSAARTLARPARFGRPPSLPSSTAAPF